MNRRFVDCVNTIEFCCIFIVSEVHELWCGHEYSFNSSRNMTQVRFDDVTMKTTLMVKIEEVGFGKF